MISLMAENSHMNQISELMKKLQTLLNLLQLFLVKLAFSIHIWVHLTSFCQMVYSLNLDHFAWQSHYYWKK